MDFPIGVFAYNRPHHLETCLQALSRSEKYLGKQLPLYIFCDAPKGAEDKKGVEETIQIANNWPGAKLIVREHNFAFRNITEGVTQLCNNYEKAIIIEDDIIVAPDFLSFVIRGLETYAHNPRVFSISGFMYFNTHPPKPETFFQTIPFCWGWATWKRAWDHFDWEPKDWQSYFNSHQNRYRFDCFGSIKFTKMLEKTLLGELHAWAPRWHFCTSRMGGLTLTPYRSLIWNAGCGGGVHASRGNEKEYYIHGTMRIEDFNKPRLPSMHSLPKVIACDEKAMRLLAITFLEEDLRKHRKKRVRKRLKIIFHKIISLISPRPSF